MRQPEGRATLLRARGEDALERNAKIQRQRGHVIVVRQAAADHPDGIWLKNMLGVGPRSL